MKLRSHHLLCLYHFQGKGYSYDFTVRLQTLWQKLQDNPQQRVRIINGPDDVCTFCPHVGEQGCQKGGAGEERQIQKMDERVLAALGFSLHQSLPWQWVRTHIEKTVGPDELWYLCSGCEWLTLCMEKHQTNFPTEEKES